MGKYDIDPQLASLVGPAIASKWFREKRGLLATKTLEKAAGGKLLMEIMAVISAGCESIAFTRMQLAMFEIMDIPGFSCKLYWDEDESQTNIKRVFLSGLQNDEQVFLVETDHLSPAGLHVADITAFGSEAYRSDCLKIMSAFMVLLNDIIAVPKIKW